MQQQTTKTIEQELAEIGVSHRKSNIAGCRTLTVDLGAEQVVIGDTGRTDGAALIETSEIPHVLSCMEADGITFSAA